MKIDTETAKSLYMTTWVRLNTIAQVDAWSAADIAIAFAMLKPPLIPFEDWLSRCGYEVQDPTELANENALNMLRSIKDGTVKVEDASTGN